MVIQLTGTDTVPDSNKTGAYLVASAGGERTVDATTSTTSIALDSSGAALNKVLYRWNWNDTGNGVA